MSKKQFNLKAKVMAYLKLSYITIKNSFTKINLEVIFKVRRHLYSVILIEYFI